MSISAQSFIRYPLLRTAKHTGEQSHAVSQRRAKHASKYPTPHRLTACGVRRQRHGNRTRWLRVKYWYLLPDVPIQTSGFNLDDTFSLLIPNFALHAVVLLAGRRLCSHPSHAADAKCTMNPQGPQSSHIS